MTDVLITPAEAVKRAHQEDARAKWSDPSQSYIWDMKGQAIQTHNQLWKCINHLTIF